MEGRTSSVKNTISELGRLRTKFGEYLPKYECLGRKRTKRRAGSIRNQAGGLVRSTHKRKGEMGGALDSECPYGMYELRHFPTYLRMDNPQNAILAVSAVIVHLAS